MRRPRRLAAAGVASPDHDAAELLAHVLGTTRPELALIDDVTPGQADEFDALVARRALREPLQHLTGTAAFRYLELAVGPGVFVPRPETELLAGWGVEQALARRRRDRAPVVVDLCTGLRRGRACRSPPRCRAPRCTPSSSTTLPSTGRRGTSPAPASTFGTATCRDAFPDLDGTVDVVLCNPPYIPLEAYESVEPEARDHDPQLSLFSGTRRPGRAARRRRQWLPGCFARVASSASSTPTSRVSPRRRCSPRRVAGPTYETTRTSQVDHDS